jgi:uncharacterized protein YoxC
MSSWMETAIIIFILAGIGVVMWKGGAANPESTGSLGRKITAFNKNFTKMQAQMTKVEEDVERLQKDSASASDIERLEGTVESLEAKVADIGESASARNATLEHVKHQVDRLYDVIVTRGMQP